MIYVRYYKSVTEIIHDSFCEKVFKTIIRDNVALAEALVKGKNIYQYNKNSNEAKDYMALAGEIIKLKKPIWTKVTC